MYAKILVLVLITGLLTVSAVGQTAQPAPLAQPAQPAEPAQPAQPAPPVDPIILSVGSAKIRQSQISALMARVPSYKQSSAMHNILSRLATQAIVTEYAKVKNMPIDEAKYIENVAQMRTAFERDMVEMRRQAEERFKEEVALVRTQMALSRLIAARTADERIQKMMTDNPQFFDGTKLEVSHVLARCTVYDSSEVQLAARARLEKVAAQIKARQMSFDEAAREHSDCDSKAKGGALEGVVEFARPMDRYFTMQAFKTAEDQISGIFRSRDGWHIVRVRKVDRGDGTPKSWKSPQGEEFTPMNLAKQAILAEIDNEVMFGALAEIPVVNRVPKPKAPLSLPGLPSGFIPPESPK